MTEQCTNVCSKVVALNLCIGCGICVAICPNQNLKIEFNQFGEYVATENGTKCPDACDMCLKVCPFSNNEENEDILGENLFANVVGIKYTPETGSYLESFVGYSNINGHRESGASGGIATWMLETLLKENLVDHVACVSSNDDPEKLFKFKICNTPEEVRECSRSCYYPVELSEIVRYILSNEGRYAIIALPCVCKAIRLAMQLNPKLQRRIKFVLGLVCGQTKSKFFAEYICALGGGDPHYLKQVAFRIKNPNRPASDYGMKWVSEDGMNQSHEGVVFWTDGMNRIWCDHYFTLNACNFCDDVFSECADAVFMDAWLAEYSSDWRGHSIVLVRSKVLYELLKRSAEKGSLSLSNLNITDTIRSQQGVLDSKRADIRERIRIAEKQGQVVPKKRLLLCNHKLSVSKKWLVRAQYLVSKKSLKEWAVAKKDLPSFLTRLQPQIIRLRRARLLEKLEHLPKRIIRKLQKSLV